MAIFMGIHKVPQDMTDDQVKEGWGKYEAVSFTGIEVEAGIMLKFSVFNIIAGANDIYPLKKKTGASLSISYSNYVDAYVGFGFTF